MSDPAPKSGEYADGKFWFHRKSTLVTIGLTSLAIEEIGQVQRLQFPDEGDDFQKGEIVVTVDGSQGNLEVTTPATGVVSEINEAAQEEPDRVSDDPLEEGWLLRFEIEDTTDLKDL